ncbi:MAG TPA: tetratricopeptide repeat protein, partial [Terriglobia bacterium]|nr:tetratricopeptide repeat protein [Terriglobia bacterium]
MTRLQVLVGVLILSAAGGCSRRLPGTGSTTSTANTAAVRSNNLGVAEMNRGRPAQALELFRQAQRGDSSLFAPRLNEGIALLNNQRSEEARAVLLDATTRQPESARAWYNLGILYRNLAQVDPAIEAFERVARIDSTDADAFYFLGQLHAQAQRYDQAIAWYMRCIALDAFHLSAEFGLARAYQLSGNDEAARTHLSRFDELTKSGLGKPISLVYGEQGQYSTAEPIAGVALAPEAFDVRFISVSNGAGIRFEPVAAANANTVASTLGSGACFFDYDADGRYDFLMAGDARGVALYRNSGRDSFTDVTSGSGLQRAGQSLGCAVGDYDKDGRDDVVVGFLDRVAVYRNQGDGTFRDSTADTGIRADGLPLGLVFVD